MSICLSIYSFVWLSVHPFSFLFVVLSVYLFICLSNLYFSLFACLYICMFIHMFVAYTFVFLCYCLSVRLSAYRFICLFAFSFVRLFSFMFVCSSQSKWAWHRNNAGLYVLLLMGCFQIHFDSDRRSVSEKLLPNGRMVNIFLQIDSPNLPPNRVLLMGELRTSQLPATKSKLMNTRKH